MFFTYVLKSLISDHYYTGHTNNLEKRLEYHNQGRVSWTKSYLPWEMIYYEEFTTKELAIKRERYFKSHAGRNWLKKINIK